MLRDRFEYLTQNMVSLYATHAEQFRSRDTMFHRNVRRDAVRIL